MGGKGRKRREKNYNAAHGGYSRLPPPPNPSQVDALPSKLRKLISFTSSYSPKSKGRVSKDGDANNKPHPKDESVFGGNDEHLKTPQHTDSGDEIVQNSSIEKRKKKRKRKPVNDLRFEAALEDTGSKKRERKKKYMDARKNKHKKAKTEEDLDFPGCEEIKFGEVVQAPPKLVTVPKALKNAQDASQQRVRLQAIEAYRSRKGWSSRPGIELAPPVTTSPAF